MGDNKRWFKVWTSILSDPTFDELPNECAGVWVRLGALIAKHGCNGNIIVTKNQFLKRTNLNEEDIEEMKKCLSLVNVEINDDCNGNISVTFKRWRHYQENTDSYERVKKWRENRLVTAACNVTKEKEKEKEKDKEKEEKKSKRNNSTSPDFFEALKKNPAYKGIDIERELAKMDAWLLTPKGRGRQKTKRFVVNWLNKIDVPLDGGSGNGSSASIASIRCKYDNNKPCYMDCTDCKYTRKVATV